MLRIQTRGLAIALLGQRLGQLRFQFPSLVVQAAAIEFRQAFTLLYHLVLLDPDPRQHTIELALNDGVFSGRSDHASSAHGLLPGPDGKGQHAGGTNRQRSLPQGFAPLPQFRQKVVGL